MSKDTKRLLQQAGSLEDFWSDALGQGVLGRVAGYTDIISFIEGEKLLNERGQFLEFQDHVFLYQPYQDMAKIQAHVKPSQIGHSTMMTIKAIFLAESKGYNIIYTLPTMGDVRDFVSQKVDLILSNNPVLQNLVSKSTSTEKKVGKSFITYRGTHMEVKEKRKDYSKALMLTADMCMFDERDRSDQETVDQFTSRLVTSKFKGEWSFSNPTSPNVGAHKIYLLSDQKTWRVTCEHCKHEQPLDWEANVDKQRGMFICASCGEELSDKARRIGRWVADYPKIDISGYQYSHMICPWISAKDMLLVEATHSKKYFYNFALGMPYKGSDVVVDKELILSSCVEPRREVLSKVAIGVDVGVKKHFVIGTKDKIIQIGTTESWDEIESLIKKYNAICVIDEEPDITIPRQLRKKYPHRVWLSHYIRTTDAPDTLSWGDRDKWGLVRAQRSRIIQETIDEFVDKDIEVAIPPGELGEYIKHWENLYQVQEKDSLDVERTKWLASGADHFCHATCYWRMACRKMGGSDAKVSYGEENKKSDLPFADLTLDYILKKNKEKEIYFD